MALLSSSVIGYKADPDGAVSSRLARAAGYCSYRETPRRPAIRREFSSPKREGIHSRGKGFTQIALNGRLLRQSAQRRSCHFQLDRRAFSSAETAAGGRASACCSARYVAGSTSSARARHSDWWSVLLRTGAGITFEICSAQAGATALMQALRHTVAERIERRRRHYRWRCALCRRCIDDGPRRHRTRRGNPDLHIRDSGRHLRRRGNPSDCAARRQYNGKKMSHDRAPCCTQPAHYLVIFHEMTSWGERNELSRPYSDGPPLCRFLRAHGAMA
jgi:hypothetical protein